VSHYLFTANDPRANCLVAALEALGHTISPVAFDDIDWFTKGVAAALSFRTPRMEWWLNYQMHPLVQSRRALVFARRARVHPLAEIDGIISWGSWFEPNVVRSAGTRLPYVQYVDQSRSILPEDGEQIGGSIRPRLGNPQQRRNYLNSRRVFCMSEWGVAQTMGAHQGLPDDRVRWAGWGPCAFDDSETPRAERSGPPTVLFVGNDFFRKGMDYLVEVAARTRLAIPSARFIVVGEDQSHSGIRLGDDIEHIGPVRDPQRLRGLFRDADVFLLPNRFERAGHVLLEALSAGVPIVTSRQGGPAELVRDETVGFGLPVGDIAGYTRAVIRLLQEPELASRMGANGKRLVRTTYNWHVVAQRILEGFIDGRQPAARWSDGEASQAA
jgi:glycosyltransferase involved in cell wall biosynthesis